MQKGYKHLTVADRDVIAVSKAGGKSLCQIGKIIGKHKSTISRELKRNVPPKNKGYYLGHKAHQRAKDRWQDSHGRSRLRNPEIKAYVETYLKGGWSPELISGRIKIDKPGLSISHEAIYQYIYYENPELIVCLVRQHKKRQKRGYSRKHKKTHIPNKISILRRPAVVAKRRRLGDWEADSIVSRKSLKAINILVERTSRMARLTRIDQKTAEATISAIKGALRIYPKSARKTITYDNGSENTGHERVNHDLGTISYFCNPYHSWEKGTVENTVGLVRRWLPKGTDFRKIKETDIEAIERWLNNRPKKCLKYKKPLEVFNELCYKGGKLGVALTG